MNNHGFKSIIDQLIKIAVYEPHRYPTLSAELAIKVKNFELIDKELWRKLGKRRGR
jgi:hypothetical protein